MQYNNISQFVIVSVFMINFIYSGIDNKDLAPNTPIKKVKVNSLVTTVPDDGNIEGLVITSCGQCKFGFKGKRGCSLTIKIGETIYPVKGTGIHDHGDAHGSEGFCSAVRVAWASGKISKEVFHANSFSLVGD